jgi:tRNA dimethylallyltransferase
LITIVGPTAVGKTAAAIELAARLDGEIVSADSRLLYRGMDIGTAKPSAEERIRILHHLIDVTNPDQAWSLAQFQGAARQAIGEIHSRGRLPFLVGGTGQYIRAVLESWVIPSGEPNLRLRVILEEWARTIGPEGLHARLATLDPLAAGSIDYRNLRRTVRAMEVILLTGRPFSGQRRAGPPEYRALLLGLSMPRPLLYARIDARIDAMVSAGLALEVNRLLSQGYSPRLPALSAIGYLEIAEHLQGSISLEEAIRRIKQRTRQFVRRQANWFKAQDRNIHWFEVGPGMLDTMEERIRHWLATD